MKQSTFNAVAGSIFGIVAVVHALRLLRGWAFVVGGWSAPMWVSWLGLALAGFLAWAAFSQKGSAG